MNQNPSSHRTPLLFLLRILQGMLIGLGAVLPGISGGVLCVMFGIYKPVMELLSNPFKNFRTHVPKLLPVILGGILGFMGIANLLSLVLTRYPDPSVCIFVGLIGGMYPSLLREAGLQGRSRGSYLSAVLAGLLVFLLLTGLHLASVTITPDFGWYLFCGFCLALSVIAPGMSFSTLLMPLGLYTPLVDGIGHLKFSVLLPSGIGAIVTVIALSKLINHLFEKHYSIAFHAIAGIVAVATIMIIPFQSFAQGSRQFLINSLCLAIGFAAAFLLDKLNQSTPRNGSV